MREGEALLHLADRQRRLQPEDGPEGAGTREIARTGQV